MSVAYVSRALNSHPPCELSRLPTTSIFKDFIKLAFVQFGVNCSPRHHNYDTREEKYTAKYSACNYPDLLMAVMNCN